MLVSAAREDLAEEVWPSTVSPFLLFFCLLCAYSTHSFHATSKAAITLQAVHNTGHECTYPCPSRCCVVHARPSKDIESLPFTGPREGSAQNTNVQGSVEATISSGETGLGAGQVAPTGGRHLTSWPWP